jgi:hypothetical protein
MIPNLTCGRIGTATEQVRNVIRARITLIVNKLTSKCKQFKGYSKGENKKLKKKCNNVITKSILKHKK